MKVKVLLVDPSVTSRLLVSEIINASPDLRVAAAVGDLAQARAALADKRLDVVVLAAELVSARADDFLAELRRLPGTGMVLVGDNVPAPGARLVTTAFALRPKSALGAQAESLRQGVRNACRTGADAPPATSRPIASDAERAEPALPSSVLNDKIIVIGASTGGTEAIREVLSPLPAEMPPILIVQHMPELFTNSFAKRLDGLCRLRVKEAEQGEAVRAGTVYIAPGHSHLSLKKGTSGWICELADTQPVNRHRPSVDVLFLSAAKTIGPRALGVLLTGMGKDGAQGLLALRQAGAWTVAQDEESSVVWGMPREAVLIGGAQEIAPLREIPQRLVQRLRQAERRAA